jgi:hypothetical protein
LLHIGPQTYVLDVDFTWKHAVCSQSSHINTSQFGMTPNRLVTPEDDSLSPHMQYGLQSDHFPQTPVPRGWTTYDDPLGIQLGRIIIATTNNNSCQLHTKINGLVAMNRHFVLETKYFLSIRPPGYLTLVINSTDPLRGSSATSLHLARLCERALKLSTPPSRRYHRMALALNIEGIDSSIALLVSGLGLAEPAAHIPGAVTCGRWVRTHVHVELGRISPKDPRSKANCF